MGIPRERLLAAAALPQNAHAKEALEKFALRSRVRTVHAKVDFDAALPEPTPPPLGVPSGALRIVLPLPAKALHPNARVHWRSKHRATKAYRREAYFAAWEALGRPSSVGTSFGPMWKSATVQIIFYFPDRRRRDPDSALASMKAGIDGLAAPVYKGIGAGIIANDSGFSFLPVQMEVDRERPRVELFVWETHGP